MAKASTTLLVLFAFLSISLYGQDTLKTNTKTTVVPQPKVLLKKAYRIQYPSEKWRQSEPCNDQNCSLYAPTDTIGFIDSFTENINITVNELSSKDYTVEQYAAFSKKYLPSKVKNFTVLQSKKLKANTHLLIYRGEKDKYKQTWKQYYYVRNQKVYIVTFACETSKYDYYLPLVDAALASFKFN